MSTVTKLARPGRWASLAAAGAAAVALLMGGSTPAQAAPATARISVSDPGYAGRWAMSGSGFASGRTDVDVWLMDSTTWTVVEHQGGLDTTSPIFWNGRLLVPAGLMGANGTQHWFPGAGLFPAGWYPDHPIRCGTRYQPVAHDAVDGYVYGAVYTEPCPIIH